MCEMVRSIDNNIEFFESKFQNKTSQIEQMINNYLNSKMNMTEPYTNYSPIQQLVPQSQEKKNTNLNKVDIEKQKIRNRINNLTKLLNRIKNKKFVELTESNVPKDIDNPFIKNLLKIGNMSHDILSKKRHDSQDNKERQMLEMWVKNRKTIKKQLQNDVSKKLAEHDRQRRIQLITLAQRKARTKRINNMEKKDGIKINLKEKLNLEKML